MTRLTLSTAESVEKTTASTSSSSIGGSRSMRSNGPESLDSGVLDPVSRTPKEGPETVDHQRPSIRLPTADPLLAAETVMSSVPEQAAGREEAPEHAAEENGDLFRELVGLPSTSARAGPGIPAAQNSGAAAAGSAETVADVATTAATSARLADVAPPGGVAACGHQLSQQHGVQPTLRPPQPLQQPLAHATTG